MKSSVLLLIVAAAAVSAVVDQLPAITRQCAIENSVPVEDIPQYYSYQFLSSLNAGENSKCYTKCLGERTGFLTAQGINAAPYIQFGSRRGRAPADTQALLDNCLAYYPTVHDCQSAWDLYVCMQNF